MSNQTTLAKVRESLCRLAKAVTKPTKYGFQCLRRDREDDSIEYQIFADTEPYGTQIAWVQSTRHDAEFLAACLAHAPLFSELLALSSPAPTAEQGRLLALIEKWRYEAAAIDRFHITMGVGYKVCANELEQVLAASAAVERTP